MYIKNGLFVFIRILLFQSRQCRDRDMLSCFVLKTLRKHAHAIYRYSLSCKSEEKSLHSFFFFFNFCSEDTKTF